MKTLFFLVQVVWQVYLTKSQEWIFPQQLSGHNYYPQQYTYQGPNRMYPNQFQSVVPDRAKMESSSERISVTKCEEYQKLTYTTTFFGGLIAGPPKAQKLSIADCDITAGLIVGGIRANPNEFPHMAGLGYRDSFGELFFKCGGSLISERFVLTAAHCHNFRGVKTSVVRMGAINLKSSDRNSEAKDFGVESFIKHEGYNHLSKQNDIAVVKLATRVYFDNPKQIHPACLWGESDIDQTQTVASGWGTTEYGGDTSDVLMKVQLDILDNNICVKTFEDIYDIVINDKQLCAGFLAGKKDTCQGDSGGPIQLFKPDNKCMAYIIGVTSFGSLCGGKGIGSVYARVSSYIDWIEQKVWK